MSYFIDVILFESSEMESESRKSNYQSELVDVRLAGLFLTVTGLMWEGPDSGVSLQEV